MPEQPSDEHYQPLAVLAVVLGALLLFAAFFIGFIVAPLAILLVFYVVFSAVDRSRKGSGGHEGPALDVPPGTPPESAADLLAREAATRRAAIDRLGAEAVPEHPDRPAK
jgi:hypothetical protein